MPDRMIIQQIEDLIAEWGRRLDDFAYLDALDEMEDRARTAREARQEEIDNAGEE